MDDAMFQLETKYDQREMQKFQAFESMDYIQQLGQRKEMGRNFKLQGVGKLRDAMYFVKQKVGGKENM